MVGASEGTPDGRVDVEGRPEGPRLGAALAKGAEETEGLRDVIGMALMDGALEVVGCPDGAGDGSFDIKGTSEGTSVGTLDVEGAEDTEGWSQVLGPTLTDGALELDGRLDGAEEGAD